MPQCLTVQLVIAVSDGHGSTKCFRSDIGARCGIVAARRSVLSLFEKNDSTVTLSAIKLLAEDQLPRRIVSFWQRLVQRHSKIVPFTKDELALLASRESPSTLDAIQERPALAYGATLLVTIIAAAYIIYVQLGDGDIFAVYEDGRVECPIPKDDRLIANETTSLSGPDPVPDVNVVFQPLSKRFPVIVCLSTDGYKNSFRDDEPFPKVGADLLSIIRSEGVEPIEADLAKWLNEASTLGSGDDVTLAMAIRRDIIASSDRNPTTPSSGVPSILNLAPAVPDPKVEGNPSQVPDPLEKRA